MEELSPFVLCPDLFYVLFVSLTYIKNGRIHIFVIHIIHDCDRAATSLHFFSKIFSRVVKIEKHQ